MTRRQFHRAITAILPAAVLAKVQPSKAQQATPSITKRNTDMQVAAKLMMFSMAVNDMPKSKSFYVDTLGLKVVSDFRKDDHNWWVGLSAPEGAAMTLTTSHENMKPGTSKVYFATSDVTAAHQELTAKGARVNEIKNDLYGPGSGVKWFHIEDPDGNQILLVQS